MLRQALAGRGRADGPAQEQLLAQFVLERGDLLRDPRLGIAELGGGGGERAKADHRQQCAKVPKIHDIRVADVRIIQNRWTWCRWSRKITL